MTLADNQGGGVSGYGKFHTFHGESTSTASQLSHKISKVPLLLQNLDSNSKTIQSNNNYQFFKFSCCEEWKECYNDVTSALTSQNQAHLPDGSGIFTQIDAFMQRCRDLQDIADCQAQFAR